MNYELFFTEKVPAALRNLGEDAPPLWGSMTAAAMLDHLRKAIDLSLGTMEVKQISKDEELPRLRHFLMGPKPFPPHSPAPPEFKKLPSRLKGRSLDELKLDLMKAVIDMLAYLQKHPGHQAIHPVFGVLNAGEWRQMHYKHFRHHLAQFAVMDREL